MGDEIFVYPIGYSTQEKGHNYPQLRCWRGDKGTRPLYYFWMPYCYDLEREFPPIYDTGDYVPNPQEEANKMGFILLIVVALVLIIIPAILKFKP